MKAKRERRENISVSADQSVENRLCLEACRAFLNEERPDDSLDYSSVDWEKVYRKAKSQEIVGILYHVYRDHIKPDQIGPFRQAYYMSISDYARKQAGIQELAALYEKHRIRYAFFKGASFVNDYPVPALRTMGDIDMVVPREQFEEAGRVLLDSGYRQISENEGYESDYIKNRVEVDLHYTMFSVGRGLSQEAGQFVNGFEAYIGEKGELDDGFQFLLVLVHLIKHLSSAGVGIRQFMDIALLTKKKKMDWDWILRTAEEVKVRRFLENVLCLNEIWFGVSSPVRDLSCDPGFIEAATDKIMNCGVFGKQNPHILEDRITGDLVKQKGNRFLSRCKVFINYLFPPRKKLYNLRPYRYLKKYRFLLPVAWIRRFFVNIANPKKILRFMKSLLAGKDRLTAMEKEMRQWGLYIPKDEG